MKPENEEELMDIVDDIDVKEEGLFCVSHIRSNI